MGLDTTLARLPNPASLIAIMQTLQLISAQRALSGARRCQQRRSSLSVRAVAAPVEEVLEKNSQGFKGDVPAGLNKYSGHITQPKSQGASQAMLYATGLTEADMSKPQVRAGGGESPAGPSQTGCGLATHATAVRRPPPLRHRALEIRMPERRPIRDASPPKTSTAAAASCSARGWQADGLACPADVE